jgi:hypothetical protein
LRSWIEGPSHDGVRMKRLRDFLTGVIPLFRPVPKLEPAPPRMPTIFLAPGRHFIDGVSVDVPADGDKDLVEYPISPGRHIVDEKIAIIPRPGIFVSFPPEG